MTDLYSKYLKTEPQQAQAGTSWQWEVTYTDYKASTYTLTYYFREVTGKYSFDITATNNNDTFRVTVPKATTSAYAPGVYSGQGFVDDGAKRFLVYENQLEVKEDFALQGIGKDTRSHAQKVLESIKALLEGKTEDVTSYSVAGRSITKMTLQELIEAKDYYERIVVTELRQQRAKQGLHTGQVVRAKFFNGF